MSDEKITETGANIGQILVIAGILIVYGIGACWLCWGLITDAKFVETGNPDDRVPIIIRIGVPTMITGFGILFLTVLLQRIKASKTDKYKDVQI